MQSGRQRYQVLKEINWEILDIQLLMGPFGSGKTTLLSILADSTTLLEKCTYLEKRLQACLGG